ncbi:hypothetical protein B7Z00_02585 [Candidatus Saccharibacteria bacterium 32-50-10]|nr:MAG: hypothetical protein B7Z00_02585 [Candidatus Saccharibacteria bacterium 32-50-10]
MYRRRTLERGFALPTIVISSLVLFMILVAAVGSASSVRVALDTQFYQQLAKDAAESGLSQATECLKNSNYTATWSTASPLRPNTNCNGGAPCPTGSTDANCYVIKTPTYYVTYTIGSVVDQGGGAQSFSVDAEVAMTRASTGAVWKVFRDATRAQVGGQISVRTVPFGYQTAGGGGAFFATVGADGVMRTAGYNGYGQLGNGTYANVTQPTKFMAPTSNAIVAGYSNFLSLGYNMFAVDSAGDAYGAGYNGTYAIGSGSTATYIPTPQKVILPAGKSVASIAPLGWATYFLTTDSNIYSSGQCAQGMLGSGYVISGCVNRATPSRVSLPTPNPSDPNTIPTSNIVADRATVFVRMTGGRVYGWGDGNNGQLGLLNYGESSTPVKIGTYGDAGQPRAIQIAYDGETLYILDDSGTLKSVGMNSYGEQGNRTVAVYNANRNVCLDNYGGTGTTMGFWQCNESAAQRFEFRANGSVYYANTNQCLDNANADGTTVRLWTCNGTPAQVFQYRPGSRDIYNPQSGKCLDNTDGNGSGVQLANCLSNYPTQVFSFGTTWPSEFLAPSKTGTFKAVTSDQWSVSALTTTGEVWSAGVNTSGQFGNGSQATVVFDPVKFQLPGGVAGASIYATNNGITTDYQFQNLFVVGTNGRVYGAGSNMFGQLGNGVALPGTLAQTTPVVMNVIDGTSVVASQVVAGYGTAVIYTTLGRVYTVGNNGSGQLGDGTTVSKSTPIMGQYINQTLPLRF